MNKNFLKYSLYGKKRQAYFWRKVEPEKPNLLDNPKRSIISKLVKATTALKVFARLDMSKKSIRGSISPNRMSTLQEKLQVSGAIIEENKVKEEAASPKAISPVPTKKIGHSFGSSVRHLEFLNLGIGSNPSPGDYNIDREPDKHGHLVQKEKRKELFKSNASPGPGSYDTLSTKSGFKPPPEKKLPALGVPRGLKKKVPKKDDELEESLQNSSNRKDLPSIAEKISPLGLKRQLKNRLKL